MNSEILVIIVTFNGMAWLERCIESILRQGEPCDIFVVDNGSTDGTVEWLRKHSIHVIAGESNIGFGAANNLGLRHALEQGYSYVYLLNQDAWLENDTLERLVHAFEQPGYGILSPVQNDATGRKMDARFARRCKKYLRAHKGEEVVEVPFISYVRHEKPELLGAISNLDWEHLVNEYGRLVNTQRRFYIETATLDMLAMIDQYDKTGKGELLRNAMRVQEWLTKHCKDRLSRQSMVLNRLQIVRRMRPLRDDEREELAKVIAKSKHAQIKYAAYLLMGDKINAKYWYGRLTQEERDEVDGLPIARFKEF